MDRPTTSLRSSNSTGMEASSTSFAATLASPVAAHLAPTNLPLNKVQRAWDRRPQSPFSRKKLRFGKVWKRNQAPSANAPGLFAGAYVLQEIGGGTPVKAVKKMRIDDGELVCDWDGRGSPDHRRIVTRSNQTEELLALDDEEELQDQESPEVEEEVSRLEVVNEDGSVQEIGGAGELEQEDWEDESVTKEDAWDATLMHLGEAVDNPATATESLEADVAKENDPEPIEVRTQIDVYSGNEASTVQSVESAGAPVEAVPDTAVVVQPDMQPQAPVIPEGFVSPIKGRRRRPISQVRQAQANRRRTLPVNFAAAESTGTEPEISAEEAQISGEESFSEEAGLRNDDGDASVTADSVNEAIVESTEESPKDHESNENEWEDIEDGEARVSDADMKDATPEPLEIPEWVDTVENTPTSPLVQSTAPDQSLAAKVCDRVAELASPTKLPSSPVPSITGPHPRLPLRRSPRRQSTSPMKRGFNIASEKSHLIAFTPVKIPIFQSTTPDPRLASSPLPTVPAPLSRTASPQMGLPQLTRSSSAPPEEPQMSPRKPGQPRLSDDTALLQAFINRASESKNGRRTSAAARRESLENRRNSDIVRQALASAAEKPSLTDVLGDLDPNSPSPRKQAPVEINVKLPSQEEQDELAQPSPAKTASRRSGRAKKKPDTLPATTYSGPNKISIRGSADSVVLKKTEAQELAQATRNNTKKNKGGAVLPPLRLTRMAKESALNSDEEASGVAMEVENTNRRGIRWAETLATFHEGVEEPEISMMIDELSAPEPDNDDDTMRLDTVMSGSAAPTPASETPSKPRQRRLKPARTAAAAAEATRSVQNEAQVEPPKDTKAKTTTKKRSRIATPAKPKGTRAAEVANEEAKIEQAKVPAARKKAVSKLPAPTASAIPAAQGKENSIIASPPKKRTKAPATPAPGSAPASMGLQPKLDFTKSVGLEKKQAENDNSAVPGIASPAKRSARTNVLFGEDGTVTKKEVLPPSLPPSLGSPAKKRTRRTPA